MSETPAPENTAVGQGGGAGYAGDVDVATAWEGVRTRRMHYWLIFARRQNGILLGSPIFLP